MIKQYIVTLVLIFSFLNGKSQEVNSKIDILRAYSIKKKDKSILNIDYTFCIINKDSSSLFYPKSVVQKIIGNQLFFDAKKMNFNNPKDFIVFQVNQIDYNSSFDSLIEIKPFDSIFISYNNINPGPTLKELTLETYFTKEKNCIKITNKGFRYYDMNRKTNVILMGVLKFIKNGNFNDELKFTQFHNL